ncbi:MAG: methyltransferase [Candidatus Bathyarchaeia archaeon]|jgi:predicted O-methyltransferase YrrM
MKELPKIKNSWGDLYGLLRIGAQSSLFVKALEWKIFDYLTEAVSAQEVAAKLNSHPRNTELFLNFLAGMEFINKKNGLFCNTEKSNEFLVSNSSTYMGAFFLHINNWSKNLLPNLDSLVKNGPPEQQAVNLSNDKLWAASARTSAVYQYCGEAQHIAHIVAALPEFPKMKLMLDLGGGAGFYAMILVNAHPSMKGVIFEQSAVASVAREFVKEYQMDARVSVMEGNYFTSDLGGPYDFIFASSTLNFYKNKLEELFSKIYRSLNPRGVFMTYQDGIKNNRTQPVSHITEFLLPELMGMDFALEQGKIAETMLRVGFRSVRSFTRHSDLDDMDIDIARK